MKLTVCFADGTLDFDAATPLRQPLGGSQSAVSYLATELARRGHRVILLTRLTRPRTVFGVECHNVGALTAGIAKAISFDAVVVRNASLAALALRALLPARTRLVLWNGHAIDQPALRHLADPTAAAAWDRIVCVSDWLRDAIVTTFKLDPVRVATLRNAIGPRFENMFSDAAELKAAKSGDPILAYTSTPFRGLDLLVRMFNALRAARPSLHLEIYSSMATYQRDDIADPRFQRMFERAKTMSGVTSFGAIGQESLAAALRPISMLAYPSTFAETSCIAVMEALAAGLHVVSTSLGALPETCMGLADLVEPYTGPADSERFVREFGGRIVAAIDRRERDPMGSAERAYEQVQTANRAFNWGNRASEWEAAIAAWRK